MIFEDDPLTCRKLVIRRIEPETPTPSALRLASRYEIIGIEVVGLGAFLILIRLLQLVESSLSSSVAQFGWVYAIIGITLIPEQKIANVVREALRN
jgi:hypothetical protein